MSNGSSGECITKAEDRKLIFLEEVMAVAKVKLLTIIAHVATAILKEQYGTSC